MAITVQGSMEWKEKWRRGKSGFLPDSTGGLIVAYIEVDSFKTVTFWSFNNNIGCL